jgi:hypothetical protein
MLHLYDKPDMGKQPEIIFPDGFDKPNPVIQQFPRTKKLGVRPRLATMFCRVFGYEHGDKVRKAIRRLIRRILGCRIK